MSENAKSITEAIQDTIDAALGSAALLTAAREVLAPDITEMITDHAEAGRFLGGGSQEDGSGYSETTLPAFFLGDLQSSGGGWQIQSDELNKTVTPNEDDLIWRTDKNGDPIAYLLGGYKEFRRLAGRSTDFVNLTFTGRMLGGVTSTARISGNKVEIETTSSENDKAYYTDSQYEWLGLHPDERNRVKADLEKYIEKKLGQRPNINVS